MAQTPLFQQAGHKYAHQNGAGTLQVKALAGYLDSVIFNQGASAATMIIYDNTAGSGTIIASVTIGSSGVITPVKVAYNLNTTTALTIVTTGTIDITVCYT